MKKYLVLILLLTILALWPFFKKGFFESHDGEWMVIRFSAFHQTLTSGQFPVRFVDRLNNNYGYPVINFLYPLPFYFTEISKLLGFGFVDSVKITFVVSTLISTFGMFWALSQRFSKEASLAGALIYLFVPYRFVDLYVRGSIGENFAFAILPLILGCIFKIANNEKIYLPLFSFSVGALLLSHNVIAAIFLPLFLAIYALTSKNHFKNVIYFTGLGILISAFFTLPAIFDLQFVKLSQIKVSEIADHMSSISNLVIPKWGYGSTPQGQEFFSPQLGLSTMLILIGAAYFYLRKKKDNLSLFMILICLISSILMVEISEPIWLKVPVLDIIQFPWRLLSTVVFASALLGAALVDQVKNKILIAGLLIFLSVVSTFKYTYPKNFTDKGDNFYSTNESTTTVRNEYMPIWVQKLPETRANEKFVVSGSGSIKNQGINKASILLNEESKIVVNTIYFPGHKLYANGITQEIEYTSDMGLISAKLPRGEHEVIIKYGKSPVHLLSEIISVLSITAAGAFFAYFLKKKQSEK